MDSWEDWETAEDAGAFDSKPAVVVEAAAPSKVDTSKEAIEKNRKIAADPSLLYRQEMPQRDDERTHFVPQLRIMKRDSAAQNQEPTRERHKMTPAELAKMKKEKERSYAEARARILGGASNEGQNGGASGVKIQKKQAKPSAGRGQAPNGATRQPRGPGEGGFRSSK